MRQQRCVSRLTSFGQPLDAARVRSHGIGVAYSATGGIMSPLPVEHTLTPTRPMEKTIAAPERLDPQSRPAFRRAAREGTCLLAEGAAPPAMQPSGAGSACG